jgi:hypothetical protein
MPEAIGIAIAWAIVIGTLGTVATVFTMVRARLHSSRSAPGSDPQEMAELRDAVHRLSGDLADLSERVDFAERLLAKQRDVERLTGRAWCQPNGSWRSSGEAWARSGLKHPAGHLVVSWEAVGK